MQAILSVHLFADIFSDLFYSLVKDKCWNFKLVTKMIHDDGLLLI